LLLRREDLICRDEEIGRGEVGICVVKIFADEDGADSGRAAAEDIGFAVADHP